MNLTFKRREVRDLQHLGTLVAENAEGIEPGLRIIGSNLNLGRSSVELAAIDGAGTPVLITLGLTADDTMLQRALEAYAWCLEYPESIQKLVPATIRPAWPPRVVFVAERLLESFVRKMRLLRFSTVDFFEYRYVEAHGTTGFYLDRVDWERSAPPAPEVADRPERVVHQRPERIVPQRLEPVAVEDPVVLEEPEREREPEPEPEREIVVHAVPDVTPPDEPKVVMLHEPKPTPRIVEPPPRIIEPASRIVQSTATNGAGKGEPNQGKERQPVVLKGLRPPTESPRGRRPRDLPHIPVPREEPAKSRRETPPAAVRPRPAEPAPATTADSRVPRGLDLADKGNSTRSVKGDVPKTDAPKGDLAPTWRKFLDRLTGTFDARTAPPPQAPRASAPPAARPAAPPATPPAPLTLQPFAADLRLSPDEVAPDEVTVEPQDATAELNEQQRGILKGLTLPDNGELAPQWRKFLDTRPTADRPTAERPTLDDTKIAVVRGYLQREFPMCTVYDFYDFQRNAQVFQLQDDHGGVTQLISVTAEFFDTHRDLEIRAWIEKHRLAHAMRQAGQAGVLVSQAGLQMEKR
jgi:hypothetical protein